MGIPLRGELSPAPGTTLQRPLTAEQDSDSTQQIISHFVRLIRPSSFALPQITITSDFGDTGEQKNAAAPWSKTATEAAKTEAVLLPLLIHLAAAKDDLESLKFCLKPADNEDEELKFKMIPGGIVNCLEYSSGRSPLHVACLNGNVKSVELLLRSGALVHLRDNLGHTALYFVSFSSRVVRNEAKPYSYYAIRLLGRVTKLSLTSYFKLGRLLVGLINSSLIVFSRTRRELATNILCIYGLKLKQDGSLT